MKQKNPLSASPDTPSLSRRAFLKKSSLATLVGVSSGVFEIRAAPAEPPRTVEDPIRIGLIGFGEWGREIAATLTRMEQARLAAVCDTYEVMLRRAERSVPQAARYTDYRAVLDDPDIQAVVIATPTHLHKQIVLDAFEAGKHVYCEAPMAHTVEDAREIARAARAVEDRLIFQVGLLHRSDPQYRSVFGFIRSGAIGRSVMTRSQWHAKQSWRRTSPNRERERALNWRLDPELSTGIIGEVGVHQLDTVFWILQERPEAVHGFGQVMLWDDGREVPDTIQAVLRFPGKVHMIYDGTLASSFDGQYDMFYGSDSTIMLRDQKAWMFKEVDAPMLGWEVYARKDKFYTETGIALVANATKLDSLSLSPTDPIPGQETPLWYAMAEFLENNAFGPYPPAANYQVGYEATVAAIKAHEATMRETSITLDDTLYDIG